jgi:ferredoxin-type protein NapH
MKRRSIGLPIAVFVFTALLLTVVQIKVDRPMLIAERLIEGGGWFQIILIACYGAYVAVKMQDPVNVPVWRTRVWTIFTLVFFGQLILGLSGLEQFLMTGKLHVPVPAMIIAGPIYRGQLSVMTILFLSTVILTGPAWCSQLCYFGAFDGIASRGRTQRGGVKHKLAIKATILLLIILVTILLRWFNVPSLIATILAIAFGIVGVTVMIWYSRKQKKMIHCIAFCPVGTVVNLTKYANPFRMYIDTNCNLCMKCTSYCKYDALSPADVRNKKPGFSCTLCGDCLAACRDNSIKYKYFNLKPEAARNLYLFLTITLHASFLALARI